MHRNDPCWCGSGKKWKHCHFPNQNQASAPFQSLKEHYKKTWGILLKTPEQIDGIRQACHLAASILDKTCAMAKEGVSLEELNDFAHKLHLEAGATPAPLHYGHPPFPKSICTSLNEVICHGIPDKTRLKSGDILNIDVTCIYKGYYGDCSRMVWIGAISEEKKLVIETSYHSMMKSIEILKPGLALCEIGKAITDYAHSRKCSVVDVFVGHGVGVKFHEAPNVCHHLNRDQTPLAAGMTFTIEPMINAGVKHAVVDPRDKWTARTADGRASGQWEHTILITETGYEILTPWTPLLP